MKLRNIVYVLKPDRSIEKHVFKKLSDTVDINGKTYVISGDSIFTGINRHHLFFKEIVRYVFTSEANIETVMADGNEIKNVNNVNYLLYNSNPKNYLYQTLLHAQAVKEWFSKQETDVMMVLLYIGFGLMIGIIMGLVFGHVKF